MKKILVLQLKRIGDTLLTTPVLSALRQALPDARIVVALMEQTGALAPALPGVDEVLVVRRRESNARLWMKLAFHHFDACLDFTGNDRSAFLSLLSKADRRITFSWVQKSAFRRLFYNEFVSSSVRENHTVDHYLDLLGPLDIHARGTPVSLLLPDASRETAVKLLKDAGLCDRYAVIHPGTARPEKYWKPERWAEVIDHCQRKFGLPCVVTGTHEPFEKKHIDAIAAEAQTPFLNLSGRIDLLTLGALIERASLLLSMDSSPVHFGAAFGTPQISLFGETNPFHWRPRHERARVILAGTPGPVAEFSPRFKRHPLSDLSTGVVIDAIGSLL